MKENTVYQFFLDSIKYELNFGAYWVYLALKRGYLQKNDHADKIAHVSFTDEDIALIYDMNRRDVLGLNRVKLYATKVEHTETHHRTSSKQRAPNSTTPSTYALYFAETPLDAQRLHHNIYGTRPTKWHSVYNQLLSQNMNFYKYGDEYKLYELKSLVKTYPFYIGEIEVAA